jgi:hypothetical protein
MSNIALERRLVKSAPELWEELASQARLTGWFGEIHVNAAYPARRLEWQAHGATGVIELESAGCATTVRIRADVDGLPAWERLQARYLFERLFRELLDDLNSGSLSKQVIRPT